MNSGFLGLFVALAGIYFGLYTTLTRIEAKLDKLLAKGEGDK